MTDEKNYSELTIDELAQLLYKINDHLNTILNALLNRHDCQIDYYLCHDSDRKYTALSNNDGIVEIGFIVKQIIMKKKIKLS